MPLEDLLMIPREGQFLMLKELPMIHREVQDMICREELVTNHQEQVAMIHSQEGLVVLMDMLHR